MAERKIDYFGSFLDAMKAPPTKTAAPAPAGETPAQSGTADAVLNALLLSSNGRAEVGALLATAGYSVDRLASVLATLASFGLIRQDQSTVELTPEGRDAARAKAAA